MTTARIRSWLALLATITVVALIGLRDTVIVFSDENVAVSASVGLANLPPTVTTIVPSTSSSLVERNSFQTFSVKLSDTDSTNILYTISTSTGVVLPTNGTVPIVGGKAQVDFTYFAPSYKARLVPITVTFNDQSGNPPIVRQINVFVY